MVGLPRCPNKVGIQETQTKGNLSAVETFLTDVTVRSKTISL